jgi:fatty acid desaturase
MIDEAPVRFTAHQLPREDLHALMARSDGPALRRTAWHLGVLAVTGTLLWRLRATAWALPLLVAHGYVLAFVFCAFHEAAHRTAFRTRWLNAVVGTLAGLLTTGSTTASRRTRRGTRSSSSRSRCPSAATSSC